MPKWWGNWLWFGVPVLGLPALVFAVIFGTESLRNSGLRSRVASSDPPQFSVLAIGWDGSRRQTIERLLSEGRLPNLKELIEQGTYIKANVGEARSDTKAGWTQIFTGYSAATTGVHSNRDYQPIPAGLTIFERLKGRYGDGIHTLFLSGKINNIGARGPHKICINCKSRFDDTRRKTHYWDEDSPAPTRKGAPKQFAERSGEPYYNALKALDVYRNELGGGDNVLKAAIAELQAREGKPYFAFIHFEEPDEQGHLFGEASQEYIKALEDNDRRLKELLDFAHEHAGERELKIYVLSDHGFDERQNSHRNAPETFWVAGSKDVRGPADRRDFTPTLLELYGFETEAITPKLDGRSLLQ